MTDFVQEHFTVELLSPETKPAKRECMDCAKLPKGERPERWRKLSERSGPRSPRCDTHQRAEERRQRERAAAYKALARYGMTPDDEEELAAEQDGTCPCGRRFKHRDHNHELAKQHGHIEPQKACKACMRGLLCDICNRLILGRGYDSTQLRALADYYDNPPAQRLWGQGAA